MIINKTNLIVFCVGIFLGLCTGFFTGKAIYDNDLEVGIKSDTVTIHDTIPDVAPVPKDSVRTKWVTRWLPRDTSSRVDHFIGANNMVDHYADTSKMIAVEIPITSKHYGCKDYDAWVSGYEPSLDSIKVYREKEIITETVTKTNTKRKPWGLGFTVGYGYDFRSKTAAPFVGVGLSYDIICF